MHRNPGLHVRGAKSSGHCNCELASQHRATKQPNFATWDSLTPPVDFHHDMRIEGSFFLLDSVAGGTHFGCWTTQSGETAANQPSGVTSSEWKLQAGRVNSRVPTFDGISPQKGQLAHSSVSAGLWEMTTSVIQQKGPPKDQPPI